MPHWVAVVVEVLELAGLRMFPTTIRPRGPVSVFNGAASPTEKFSKVQRFVGIWVVVVGNPEESLGSRVCGFICLDW